MTHKLLLLPLNHGNKQAGPGWNKWSQRWKQILRETWTSVGEADFVFPFLLFENTFSCLLCLFLSAVGPGWLVKQLYSTRTSERGSTVRTWASGPVQAQEHCEARCPSRGFLFPYWEGAQGLYIVPPVISWRAESKKQRDPQVSLVPRLILHPAPPLHKLQLHKMPGSSRSHWAHPKLPEARTSIHLSLESLWYVFEMSLETPVSQSTMYLKIEKLLIQDNFVFKQQDQQKMPSGNWLSCTQV